MGNFHEQRQQVSEKNNFLLQKISFFTDDIESQKQICQQFNIKSSICEFHNLNASEAKEIIPPTIKLLGTMLFIKIKEIEAIRLKPNILYFAEPYSEYAIGHTAIDSEDLKHIETAINENISKHQTNVDFLLTSSGGYLEPTLMLSTLLRQRFSQLSFLLVGPTFSSASALALSGNEIIMQSSSHLAIMNPRINGYDTYNGKSIYRAHKFCSIFFPWSVKHLPAEAEIAKNVVTIKVLKSLEKLVTYYVKNRLSLYLMNTADTKNNTLTIFGKIKRKIKINKITNYLTEFGNHYSHRTPFYHDVLVNIGLPVKKADNELDEKLRQLRNICQELVATKWKDNSGTFHIRKIYFCNNSLYFLKCYI